MKPLNSTNKPVAFINAEVRQSQNGGAFIWSKTFDLQEIANKLGTTVVTVSVVRPRNPRTEAERTIIFNIGDVKYLPKAKQHNDRNVTTPRTEQGRGNGNGDRGNGGRYASHDDLI